MHAVSTTSRTALVVVLAAASWTASAPAAHAQIVLPPPPPVTVDVCGVVAFDGSCGRVVQAPDGARYAVSDWLDATLGVEAQVGDEVRLVGEVPFGLCFNECEPGALCVFNTTVQVSCTPGFELSCFGNGVLVDCPCANNVPVGAFEGCENTTGEGGRLIGQGTTSVAADDMSLVAAQLPSGTPGLVVSGRTETLVPFRDGVLCAGNPTTRVEVLVADATGTAVSTEAYAAVEALAPGDERVYQLWYRDPVLSPCGSGSNFTNAVRVRWQ